VEERTGEEGACLWTEPCAVASADRAVPHHPASSTRCRVSCRNTCRHASSQSQAAQPRAVNQATLARELPGDAGAPPAPVPAEACVDALWWTEVAGVSLHQFGAAALMAGAAVGRPAPATPRWAAGRNHLRRPLFGAPAAWTRRRRLLEWSPWGHGTARRLPRSHCGHTRMWSTRALNSTCFRVSGDALAPGVGHSGTVTPRTARYAHNHATVAMGAADVADVRGAAFPAHQRAGRG